MEFYLSPHEVLRGIALRDDRLLLPAGAAIRVGAGLDALVGAAMVGGAILAGGGWWLGAVPGAYFLVEGLARLRVRVVATRQEVVVRNRWRTHRIPMRDIRSVRIETVSWILRRPALDRDGLWPSEKDWEVGTILHGRGHEVACDALISAAPEDDGWQLDPTAADQKVAALRRWVEASRS